MMYFLSNKPFFLHYERCLRRSAALYGLCEFPVAAAAIRLYYRAYMIRCVVRATVDDRRLTHATLVPTMLSHLHYLRCLPFGIEYDPLLCWDAAFVVGGNTTDVVEIETTLHKMPPERSLRANLLI